MNNNSYGKSIWISEQVISDMIAVARSSHPYEIGGILTGVLIGNRPWITKAMNVTNPKKSKIKFYIPAQWRPSIIDEIRKEDERIGYIGEWHSHPKDVSPSRRDRKTIKRIALDVKSNSQNPILLILRRIDDSYNLDTREWSQGNLHKVDIIKTGNLPDADH